MILFPAIDIKNGKVVRLLQGRFDAVTEYSADPLSMARHWKSLGATWIHIVDLDGALTGEMKNIAIIKQIADAVDINIEVGGGIRSETIIEDLIQSGVERVILGTKVVEDEEFLTKVLKKWPSQIAVSIDHSGGLVVTRGWVVKSTWPVIQFAQKLEKLGLKYLISTNVALDGMLTGPDFDGIKEILNTVKLSVIASGGISNIDDIKKLSVLEKEYSGRLIGAITGKAIYEGKLDFKEALALC